MKTTRNTERLYLSDKVRLRVEHFGGLVFDRCNGTILEVDRQGFDLLLQARTATGIYSDDSKDTDNFINRLLELNILDKCSKNPVSFKVQETLKSRQSYPCLSAPETAHWAVTYRCGMKCPDCYVARIAFPGKELNTSEAKKLIDKLAEWQVFQLALGGGEPLERNDIVELVKYAAKRGLIVHLTTGRQFVNSDLLEKFAGSLASLQLGIHADWRETPKWRTYLHGLSELRMQAVDYGIKVGANLCLSHHTVKNFGLLISELGNIGLRRFTLLRYKPPQSVKRWQEELPNEDELLQLKPELELLSAIPDLDLRIDCALSFLQNDLPAATAAEHGIIGCSAGNRIVSVAPDGSLYPCSQLVTPNFCAGNIYLDDPDRIWHDSKILRKYRDFRNEKSFADSHCGVCSARKSCGGCRAFAHDAIGGDPGCPEWENPKNYKYPGWIDKQNQHELY